MTLGGLERSERQHDDVRLVRLHLHVRLLGLVADRQSRGEPGAEPRGDLAAASSSSATTSVRKGSESGRGRMCGHILVAATAAPTQAEAQGVSNARLAHAPGMHGPAASLGCYTFRMVTLPLSSLARSSDRGAWPWRRCRSLARS